MTTPRDFAIALLDRLSLPKTTNNVVSLVAFIGIEGTWPAGRNPLNTMLPMPGAVNRLSNGVKAYPDWSTGLEATARTLAQSNMRGIIDALRKDVDPQDFLRALSDSPWCSAPSTVANRAPKCPQPSGTPCYCDYAAFSANALYAKWANRDDGSGALATSSRSPLESFAVLIAIAVLLGVVWYKWGKRYTSWA